jgi:L-amino acid N-acyltransferase YncA
MSVAIRPATEADMAAVLTIYNYEVAHGVATFDTEPRSMEEQLAWLEEHQHPYSAIVVESAGQVIAFGSLSRYHSRPAYGFTVEDTVYVHHEHRRQGVGRLVLEELIGLAREGGYHTVLGRITAENTASIELHRACGFFEAGVEREVGRKFGRWLDVVTMQLILR